MATTWQQKLKAGALTTSVLAIAAAPLGVSAISDSDNSTVTATVNEVISVSTSGNVAFTIDPTADGALSSSSHDVSVSTNSSNGYTLSLADSDGTTNMVSGGNSITAASTGGTAGALSAGQWGWAVPSGTTGVGVASFDASYLAETSEDASTTAWAGVPATGSPVTVKTAATEVTADSTTVWYAAKVDTSQPNGSYVDTVTYTATTN